MITIDSKRELFIDTHLIDSIENAELFLHEPQISELDESPLEGGYVTVIKDGDSWKRFYRVSHGTESYDGNPGELTCMDISDDGIHWRKEDLGVFGEIDGRRNIVWTGDPPRSHNFSPFIDTRLGVSKHQRWKALSGTHKMDGGRPSHVPPLMDKDSGLYAFSSPDGVHWSKMTDNPVITWHEYAFDSQNVSFWSDEEQCYVCFFRCWEPDPNVDPAVITASAVVSSKTHLRSIARTTSTDFIHWTEPVRMHPNIGSENLYTSQAHPYYRAPHIYVSLATRFIPSRGNSTDIMFMTTRSGSTKFDRTFKHAFFKPGPDPNAWLNRSNYASLNIHQYSDYVMSWYVRGRRVSLRIDGFASVRAKETEGHLVTKTFTFTGKRLLMNYATSAAGSVKVILNEVEAKVKNNHKIVSTEVVGDFIDGEILFADSQALERLSGKAVIMEIYLKDANVYSFKFMN
ncbi:MAG: hypothetical protein WC199_05240 [Dysgonamonadaceae bacterium]